MRRARAPLLRAARGGPPAARRRACAGCAVRLASVARGAGPARQGSRRARSRAPSRHLPARRPHPVAAPQLRRAAAAALDGAAGAWRARRDAPPLRRPPAGGFWRVAAAQLVPRVCHQPGRAHACALVYRRWGRAPGRAPRRGPRGAIGRSTPAFLDRCLGPPWPASAPLNSATSVFHRIRPLLPAACRSYANPSCAQAGLFAAGGPVARPRRTAPSQTPPLLPRGRAAPPTFLPSRACQAESVQPMTLGLPWCAALSRA
jgi:hypothetical protein